MRNLSKTHLNIFMKTINISNWMQTIITILKKKMKIYNIWKMNHSLNKNFAYF